MQIAHLGLHHTLGNHSMCQMPLEHLHQGAVQVVMLTVHQEAGENSLTSDGLKSARFSVRVFWHKHCKNGGLVSQNQHKIIKQTRALKAEVKLETENLLFS